MAIGQWIGSTHAIDLLSGLEIKTTSIQKPLEIPFQIPTTAKHLYLDHFPVREGNIKIAPVLN
jgi:hypothetical protein